MRGSATLALTLLEGHRAAELLLVAPRSAGVSGPTRQRFPISGDGHGLSWRLAQTGASTQTELYAVEAETRSYGEQADG